MNQLEQEREQIILKFNQMSEEEKKMVIYLGYKEVERNLE